MKRLFLAVVILGLGAIAFCSLRNAGVATRKNAVTQTAVWQTQTQAIAQLYLEKQSLVERIDETKQLIASQPAPLPHQQLVEKILSGDYLKNLSAAETEKLLAELGFDWNTTGDYLIISKKSLDGIDYDAMKGMKLTDAALGTLAITPSEQAAIEDMTKQLGKAQSDWAKAHVQRTEPSGKVLAQYSLPADANFSNTQLATYTNGIASALGEKRAAWLQNHSLDWMQAMGLFSTPNISGIPAEMLSQLPASLLESKPTTMTLSRYQSGDTTQINLELQQAGGSMTTTVTPWQPFPEAFRAIFPSGWKDVAEREGFELPKAFQKK